MSATVIQKALTDWITLWAPAWKPFHTNQDAPEPNVKYISLDFPSKTKIGDDVPGPINDDNVTRPMNGTRELILSLQAVGDGANDILETLATTFDFFSVKETFATAGLVFVTSEPVRNITRLIQESMVERAVFDIRFRIASLATETVGSIIDAEVTGGISSSMKSPYNPIPVSISISGE